MFFYSLAGKHMPFSLLQISLFWQEQFFLHSFPKWLWSHPVNFFQIINIYKESTIDESMELSDSQTWHISTSIHISIYLQCIFLSFWLYLSITSFTSPPDPSSLAVTDPRRGITAQWILSHTFTRFGTVWSEGIISAIFTIKHKELNISMRSSFVHLIMSFLERPKIIQ